MAVPADVTGTTFVKTVKALQVTGVQNLLAG